MTAPPLAGITVVDFSELLPGPFLTQSLVELGAEVVKIERPPSGDGTRRLAPAVFTTVNRGKRSILADLKQPAEVDRIRGLIARADVLVEAYRPGVMARLGLDYPTLTPMMPRLIYASITGYGQTGPMANRPGHDVNYLATAGAIALSGTADGDPAHAFGLPAADLCAATYALSAILAALLQRATTGRGQYLDIAMADCVAHWMNVRIGPFVGDGLDTLADQRADTLCKPAYGVFRCGDGATISIGALEDHFWERLCGVFDLGRFAAAEFRLFAARVAQARAINELLAVELSRIDATEAEARLRARDVPVVLVVEPSGLAAHPQFAARGLYRSGLARFPITLEGVAATPGAPPQLDADRSLAG